MENFCPNCGEKIEVGAAFCRNCGAKVQEQPVENQVPPQPQYQQQNYYENTYNNVPPQQSYGTPQGYQQKSKLVAGLLQILLPGLGIGRFYLGYAGIGVGQILTSFLCGVGCVWGFIDGILILTGSVTVDSSGIPLRD